MRPPRFPNMRVVPLYIRFGDDAYKDGVEMDATTFYERLAAAPQLPTTSQPTPQDFIDAYHELDGYDRIWSLHLTSKLSGTFQSACLAAEELGGDRVTLVDTETASLSVAQLSLAMQRRLERGTTDEELTSSSIASSATRASCSRSGRSSTCRRAVGSERRRRWRAVCST